MSIPSPLLTRRARPEVSRPGPAPGERLRAGHVAVAVVIAGLHAAIYANLSDNGDMLWGTRFGAAVWNDGIVPRVDSYSWSAHGSPLIANSWAWNVVLYLAHSTLGVWGYWLLGLAVSFGLAAAVLALMHARVGRPVPVLAAYSVLGLVAMLPLPRAQAVSDVLVVVLPCLVARMIGAGTRRGARTAFATLVGFQIVWINLHESGLLGPGLVLCCGLALSVGRRRQCDQWCGIRRTVLASTTAAIACLVTPYGLSGVTHAAEVRAVCIGLVSEWEPAGFASAGRLAALLAAAAGLALSVWVWRSTRRYEFASAISVLSLCSLYAIRFLPMLAAVSIVEVGAWLGMRRARAWVFRAMTALGIAVLIGRYVTTARDLAELGPSFSPRLVAAVPHGCRTLNDDVVGDAEVLLRPDVQVSLDGRFDMYGRSRILHILSLADATPGTAAYLAANHVDCVLLPTGTKTVQNLVHDPHWKRITSDQLRTLLVRR